MPMPAKYVTAFGERLRVAEWSERFGVPSRTIRYRLNSPDWTPEDAVSECPKKGSCIDLIGKRFGRLVVVRRAGNTLYTDGRTGQATWTVQCDCDPNAERLFVVASADLRKGKTRSCGCYAKERIHEWSRTHGESNGPNQRGSAEYRCWTGIIARCENHKVYAFKDYGGRGIRMCERWRNSYEAFLSDMGRKPSPAHSIDRIDVNGHYEPGNCRWATRAEQVRNRRDNVFFTVRGETLCLTDWARRLGCLPSVIRTRLANGWPEDLALLTPARSCKRRPHLAALPITRLPS